MRSTQYDPSNPTQDIVSQLKALGDKVKYQVGEGLTFSHLDFDSSPEGKLADIRVRQAFLKCIPRQELVDKFAKPVLPGCADPGPPGVPAGAGQLPGDPGAGSGGHQVRQVDIAGAKQLLTDAGVTQPYTSEIIRSATSDLRGQQVAVIKASCDQAGFNIQDMPDPDIFTTITTRGTWDAALFGWSSVRPGGLG